ncbi:MAG: PAN domain-containing protein [Pseudomonadota bacterium]
MIAQSRFLLTSVLACAAIAFAAPAVAEGADVAEVDTYRFGGTFARLQAPSPAVCAAFCTEDDRCEAWSHAPETIEGAPQCELKRVPGRAENRPGYTSGIAGFHQVGALRDEAGSFVQAVRRNTATMGMRARDPVFPEGYRAVSSGIEVEDLLGGSKPASTPPQRSTPPRIAPPPVNRYAPLQIVQAQPSAGTLGGPSVSSGFASSSTDSYDLGSSSSQAGGGQVILARPTSNAQDPAFYYDDDDGDF